MGGTAACGAIVSTEVGDLTISMATALALMAGGTRRITHGCEAGWVDKESAM